MMNFHEYTNEAVDADVIISHNLSGVILIYNNKILLVRPKKFKKQMKKFQF